MVDYVIPILFFVLLGALAGVLLTVAAKLLAVKNDETVENLLSILPGANCGACGYSGCEGYAKALAEGSAASNLCKPGNEKVANELSAQMGVASLTFLREVAFVHCNGNCQATADKYTYNGTKTCAAVNNLYSGKGTCTYGCSGFGDCVNVCEYDAMHIVNGVAVVNPSKCAACGLCVKICPNKLITLRKVKDSVAVACSSRDAGKKTKAICKNGCIACKICEKKCPSEAIVVHDNHAIIDYSKCTSCGICVSVCPIKCIELLPECGTKN